MSGYEPADDEGGMGRERTIGERGGRTSGLRKRIGNGTVALAAGGVMLARAVRAVSRSPRRAARRALAGASLIAIGVRQRRSTGGPEPPAGGYSEEQVPTGREADSPDVTFPDQPDDEEVEIDISETDVLDEVRGDDDGSLVGDASETAPTDAERGDVPPTHETGDEAATDEGAEESDEETGMDESGVGTDEHDAGMDEEESDASTDEDGGRSGTGAGEEPEAGSESDAGDSEEDEG
ncbi:hypothetical protein BRC81_07340 [Halobacteriales archaeon QS_1_68_20]|nr:MAG: hypothetical protein BRC81_07340 [Halobacteriales archaeon QS_1_68_20]